MFFSKYLKTKILILLIILLGTPVSSVFADMGESVKFNVDSGFDASGRSQLSATLVKTDGNFYFYVEKQWWDSQTKEKQNEVLKNLDDLSSEFNSNIRPKLTSVYGDEWNPGIDNDSKIVILFESMNSSEGGYLRTADEYDQLQVPDSNEREMVYISLDQIEGGKLKTILAHEFVHLITFNQKNIKHKLEEDTWLNEARADYASTILGYDNIYPASNLEARVKDFVVNPLDSITEWNGTKYDYASVSLFTHYLVNQYGLNILTDSLNSEYVGIESINYALLKSGAKETFDQVFANWAIASVINNCSRNLRYCYTEENLKTLKIAPSLNFIPMTGDVSLSVSDSIKNWSAKWLKFIGGSGDLELVFSAYSSLKFKIPYITEDINGKQEINYLDLDQHGIGKINIEDFGDNYKYIILIPLLQSKQSGFDEPEYSYGFTYSISMKNNVQQTEDQSLIQQLTEKINALKAQLQKLQQGNNVATTEYSCSKIESNLYYGMTNNAQVKCLQEFLKSQGADIYSEGYITGNFWNMTFAAVKRFQKKYASEILIPVGLSEGTGFVGETTRQKINKMLAK